MNRIQQRAVHYARVLNDVIEKMQSIQDDLNPKFEKIKAAMSTGNLTDMKSSEYLKIQGDFQRGADDYGKLAEKLCSVQAPAKLRGIHLSLIQALKNYTQSCQKMIDSMKDDRTVDEAVFQSAEKAQDHYLDKISKYLMKMGQLSK